MGKVLDATPARLIDSELCTTTAELCKMIGVTRATLSNWESDGCPKAAHGWWPIGAVLRWRGLVGNGGVNSPDKVADMVLAEQKLHYEVQLKKAQSESTEFKNAVSRGDYLQREDVISQLQRGLVVIKRSMMGVSRKVATELAAYVSPEDARRIEHMVAGVMRDGLEQVSIDGVYKAPRQSRSG